MKTIFVTCFNTLISRNIIATDVLPRLAKNNVRVVVLVPDYKRSYFEETYASAGIVFEGVDTGRKTRSRRVSMFKRLAEAMPQTRRARLGRRRTFRGELKSPFLYYGFYTPVGALGRFRWVCRLVRFFDLALSPRGRFQHLLEHYRPDFVFSTDIQNEHDVSLMQEARRSNTKIIGMVRSWDNLSTRLLRILPDRFLVHNEIIRGELETMYGISASRVTRIGIPHYDLYKRSPHMSRSEFFAPLKLDPAKPLIFYTPICDFRLQANSVDRYILDILATLDANTIVRFHPAESSNIEGFTKPPRMTFDEPGHVFDPRVRSDRDITPQDNERYIHELAYADVVISGPSTVIIDAAVFDKPILLVDFYPRPVSDDERIYEYGAEHMAPILASDGVAIAKSKEEFLEEIQAALRDPSQKHNGRVRIVSEQVWQNDGQASERLLSFLKEALGIHDAHRPVKKVIDPRGFNQIGDYVATLKRWLLLRWLGQRNASRTVDRVYQEYAPHWVLHHQDFQQAMAHESTWKFGGRLVRWSLLDERRFLVHCLLRAMGDAHDFKSVLELGSGDGFNVLALAAMLPSIRIWRGIELTSEGVRAAEELRANPPFEHLSFVTDLPRDVVAKRLKDADIRFSQGDIRSGLPLEDGYADVVFTCLTIEQLPRDYLAAFKEARRLTKRRAVFLEEFCEAQKNVFERLYLKNVDYFSASYLEVERAGFSVLSFAPLTARKLHFSIGILVCTPS